MDEMSVVHLQMTLSESLISRPQHQHLHMSHTTFERIITVSKPPTEKTDIQLLAIVSSDFLRSHAACHSSGALFAVQLILRTCQGVITPGFSVVRFWFRISSLGSFHWMQVTSILYTKSRINGSETGVGSSFSIVNLFHALTFKFSNAYHVNKFALIFFGVCVH